MRKVLVVVAAVLAAGTLLLSCGDDADEEASPGPEGTWVGTVEDSGAFIGVVAGKATVVAWICDGEDEVALRFAGPRLGDAFDITLPLGARLAGVIEAERVVGTVTTGSDLPRPFTTEAAKGDAGLYSATATVDGDEIGVAWVVLNDGKQKGSTVGKDGIQAASPLDLESGRSRVGGTSATAARITSGGAGSGFQFGGGFGGFGGSQTGQFGFQLGQSGGQFGQSFGGGGFGGGKFGFGG